MPEAVLKLEDLRIGQLFELKKHVIGEDIQRFAAVSGDWGRLHTDPEFAKRNLPAAGGCIVHGMLICSYISALVNQSLGHGAMVTDIIGKFRFIKVGSMLTLQIKITKIDLKRRCVKADCFCEVNGEPSKTGGKAIIFVLPDQTVNSEK